MGISRSGLGAACGGHIARPADRKPGRLPIAVARQATKGIPAALAANMNETLTPSGSNVGGGEGLGDECIAWNSALGNYGERGGSTGQGYPTAAPPSITRKVPDTSCAPSPWSCAGPGTIRRRPRCRVYRATKAAVPTACWVRQRRSRASARGSSLGARSRAHPESDHRDCFDEP